MTLAGFLPPRAGTITLHGQPVTGFVAAPHEPGRPGARPRLPRPVHRADPDSEPEAGAPRGADLDPVLELFPALQRREKLRVGDLSGGEQQMLAIARALVQSPKLLLIDEMSMGLAPVAVESLMPVIRRVADEHGASVIMVEQHVQLALEVADEAMVLVHGSIVLSGPAENYRNDTSAVEAAYMSGSVDSGLRTGGGPSGPGKSRRGEGARAKSVSPYWMYLSRKALSHSSSRGSLRSCPGRRTRCARTHHSRDQS